MNNTDKLNASQYLVKQAILAKLFAKATPYAQKAMEFGKQFASGAANPVHAGADMLNMAIPTSMGGRFAKFDPNVLARGLGGGTLLGGIGLAPAIVGASQGRREGFEQGARAGVEGAKKQIMESTRKKHQANIDRGYFGRLLDAVTNKGYSAPYARTGLVFPQHADY